MDNMKVNNISPVNMPTESIQTQQADGSFKFVLASNVADAELQARLSGMLEEISKQGERLKKKMDIRDMKRYRLLIKDFMNEVVNRSHEFTRENFLDRRGRHRVYGMIRQIDDALDELARELVEDEKDSLAILSKVDEIRGLLLDIFM